MDLMRERPKLKEQMDILGNLKQMPYLLDLTLKWSCQLSASRFMKYIVLNLTLINTTSHRGPLNYWLPITRQHRFVMASTNNNTTMKVSVKGLEFDQWESQTLCAIMCCQRRTKMIFHFKLVRAFFCVNRADHNNSMFGLINQVL